MSLSKLPELVMDREAWRPAVRGVGRSRTWLSDWIELKTYQWLSQYSDLASAFKHMNALNHYKSPLKNSPILCPADVKSWFWKRLWCWERLEAGREGDGRVQGVGWRPRLEGHGSERALGVSDGQGGLARCGHGVTEPDTAERLGSNHARTESKHEAQGAVGAGGAGRLGPPYICCRRRVWDGQPTKLPAYHRELYPMPCDDLRGHETPQWAEPCKHSRFTLPRGEASMAL